MSALDNTPTNKNFLSQLNFQLQIKRAPHVNFFIQEVNLPSLKLPPTQYPNPMVRIPEPGEHLEYGDLVIKFKVDEDLQNYMEIHRWIEGLGKPKNFFGYQKLEQQTIVSGEGIKSDIAVSILSNVKNPNYQIIYTDAFPIELGGLEFIDKDATVNYLSASAIFKYTYYNIEKII